jgi:hypothetical protein
MLCNLPSYLPPLLSSLSIGCFRAVISRKVNKNKTTKSRSFRMGAICNRSHNGVSRIARKVEREKGYFLNYLLTMKWKFIPFFFVLQKEKKSFDITQPNRFIYSFSSLFLVSNFNLILKLANILTKSKFE